MADRHQAGVLLRSGLTLPEIAVRLRRGLDTVIQDLRLLVGEGELQLTDLFFAMSAERRHALESLVQQSGATTPAALQKAAKQARLDFSFHEIHLYSQLRDAPRVLRGDLYVRIADFEVDLHQLVRRVLVDKFGPGEAGWWRQGVPEGVRVSCAQARERDPEPVDELFGYTTLVDLADIIKQNWNVFSPRLPHAMAKGRPGLLQDLRRLNAIRNAVMHPVKGRPWTREDLEFVEEIQRSFAHGRPAR